MDVERRAQQLAQAHDLPEWAAYVLAWLQIRGD
jgi:hypothetical protein